MNKEATREHILQVATGLFASRGFAPTSMNDIVRESGLSKGGVYWHFSSKNDIIAAIFDQYFTAQLEVLVALKEQAGSASARLRSFFEFVAQGLSELGQQFPQPLEFYAQASRDTELLQRFKQYLATYTDHVASLIQAGIDDGEFAAHDPHQAAHLLLAIVEGLLLLHDFSSATASLQTLVLAALQLFLSGLQHPPAT